MAAPQGRVLIVANRLPVALDTSGGRLLPSTGGLATGLLGPHEQSRGLWFGWPGPLHKIARPRREEVLQELRGRRLLPIALSAVEVQRYYSGFANGVLWPVFHYLLDRVPMGSDDWEHYRAVNQRFADEVAGQYREGDVIWVHDYHLMLVPEFLRRRLPGARIGFFLHIPFPSSEVFRVLPWRAELLRGLLGADLIGFHTLSYTRHFAAALLRILGIEVQVDRLVHEGREVRIGAYPMGVDVPGLTALARHPEVQAQARSARAAAHGARIVLGVDRLDYTKGIPQRLLTFERLLDRHPELRGKVQMVLVAAPSRSEVHEYQNFKRSVDELVGRISGRFATPDYSPIRYLNQSLGQRQVVALYLAADVLLVTPLRDGLNLVAKEFVAAREDHDGVLVVSEFAGVAAEMAEALSMNPHDVDGTVAVVARALAMPQPERVTRMRALREHVERTDVHIWARTFLGDLGMADPAAVLATAAAAAAGSDIREAAQRLRAAERRVLFLDYDGTLVPFAARPKLAAPDRDLLALLEGLSALRGTEVHLVSGRDSESLERWFGSLRIGLHGEHGLTSRAPGARSWVRNMEIDGSWMARVKHLLERVARHVPGSFVEEKTRSLTWHYRRVEPGFATSIAMELRLHLLELLSNLQVTVTAGEKVLEIRPQGVHKGIVVTRVLGSTLPGTLAAAIGDDRTDEDLFEAIPATGVTIHVGQGPSVARCRVPDVRAVRQLLGSLVTDSTRATASS